MSKNKWSTYICSHCGSKLAYDPKSKNLKCKNCNKTEKIEISTSKIIEKELGEIDKIASKQTIDGIKEKSKVIYCKSCWAKTIISADTTNFTCRFCSSKYINEEVYKDLLIKPMWIIPFVFKLSKAK